MNVLRNGALLKVIHVALRGLKSMFILIGGILYGGSVVTGRPALQDVGLALVILGYLADVSGDALYWVIFKRAERR